MTTPVYAAFELGLLMGLQHGTDHIIQDVVTTAKKYPVHANTSAMTDILNALLARQFLAKRALDIYTKETPADIFIGVIDGIIDQPDAAAFAGVLATLRAQLVAHQERRPNDTR
jgi:hypothetical protein